MANCDKLFVKARNSPNNFAFREICELAECKGWEFRRQSSSHFIFENPKLTQEQGRVQNLQDFKGKAKPYQVRQLLRAIEFLEDED